MKIIFIVNPVAGNGRAREAWERVENLIKGIFNNYDVAFTSHPLHAVEIARDAVKSGYDTVVSCGGDGTLNEVINGTIGSNVKVGLIPTGTGSDFGKTLGIRGIEKAIEVIKNGKSEKIDVVKVDYGDGKDSRYFVNILEIGFGAEVMNYVNSHKKGRKYSFILGILSVIWKLQKFNARFDTDSSQEMKTIEVIIANGKYFGGGMFASPISSIDDGFLDVHVLKPVSKITTLSRMRDLISGEYISKGYSYDFRAKSFSYNGDGNLFEMDGEVIGHTPLRVTVMERALNFLIP